MSQYEKVIKGLECYLAMRRGEKVECKMGYCPYWEEDDDTGLSLCNTYQIQADALALLKAHEIATVEPKRINLTDETKAWLDKMNAVDALRNIADICMDWDGYRTADGLGELVNEIWTYARYCSDRLQKAQELRTVLNIFNAREGTFGNCPTCNSELMKYYNENCCGSCGKAVKWE